jgi:hypothetical protein
MTAQEIALQRMATLAPLKEQTYQPQNLSPKDAALLKTISENLVKNTDMTISALQAMVSNLRMYKEVMVDSINAQGELVDLEMKYESNPPQQVHSLPGITTLPPAYDLSSIKSDNERFETLKDMSEKAEKQRDLYVKIIQQEFKLFSQSLRRLLYNDNTFSTFVGSLQNKI